MSKPLSLLIVEDSENDALLLLRHLRQHGYDLTYERVDTAAGMKAALEKRPWDIVISDYFMPQFSALDALSLLRETKPDMPFIVVSGKIGEDTAVAAMKAGASDYIMKTSLKRLVPAIEREVQEALVRQERTRSAEALKQSEEQLRLSHEMEQLKDDFIGLVSHELRTPLTVVLGALNTVNSDWDRLPQEGIRQLLRDALTEAESLSGILANLLVLARAQAGRLELFQEPVSLRQALEGVLSRSRPQPATPSLAVDIGREQPFNAPHPIWLARLLSN